MGYNYALMVYSILVALYLLVCLLLLLVVLMQQGKGGDMASALFMLGAIILGVYGQRGPGSVVSGVKGPAAPVSAPVLPAPTPAPVKK